MKMLEWLLLTLVSFVSHDSSTSDGETNSPLEPGDAKINIRFSNTIGNELLELDSTFLNPFGEYFTVKHFKYYISHVALHGAGDNSSFTSQEHYLVDQSNDSSRLISKSISEGKYMAVSFLVGVDSLHNTGFGQSGSLDPANGMFWDPAKGYIMAKLEGTSTSSSLPQKVFVYEVGGYKVDVNALRRVVLFFAQDNPLSLVPGSDITLLINADLNHWFNATTPVRISKHPVCKSPGYLATTLADNYSKMFTLSKVIRN